MRARLAPSVLAAFAATVLLWASAYAGIRVGLAEYSPGQVALFRLLTASVVLALYALVTRMRLPEVRDLPAVLLLGFVAFNVYHAALNFGERTVGAGAAGVLIATVPVITALLAAVVLRERLRPSGRVGMILSFAGAALIFVDEGQGFSLDPEALLILLSAVCVSVYFIFQKPYLGKYGALAFMAYAVWAGTFFALVYLPGLVAQVGASPVAANFLYLVPVLAYLIAWAWVGVSPTQLSVVGGMIVLAGVFMVNRRGGWFICRMRRGHDARSQEAGRLDSPRIHPETRIGCVCLKAANLQLGAEYPLDGASEHGVSEALYLRGLDDNGTELYWDRPREAWPYDGEGNPAMGTQPLDARGLLAELDGAACGR